MIIYNINMKLTEKISRAIPIAIRLMREKLAEELTYRLLDRTMLKNVFKRKDRNRRVLMVSIPAAFNKTRHKYHTSIYEAYEVGNSMNCITPYSTRQTDI